MPEAGHGGGPRELALGLWCWTAAHPAWAAGHGWERDVSCYCLLSSDAAVFVDPLLPESGSWGAYDALAARQGRPVAIVLSRAGHFRSANEFALRYNATIHGHASAAEAVDARVEFRAVGEGDALPGAGVVLNFDVPGLDHTPFYFARQRAGIPGDILIRAEGGVRLWWAPEDDGDVHFLHERHIPALRGWLERPIEHVLLSHGDPVIGDGEAELLAAFSRPTWKIT